MTDKKTGDEDFSLNHLDDTADFDPFYDDQKRPEAGIPAADDPLANHPRLPDRNKKYDPYVAPWDDDNQHLSGFPDRMEPTVATHNDMTPDAVDAMETETDEAADMESPAYESITATDRPEPPVQHTEPAIGDTDGQSPGQRLPTILAVVAILLSALALLMSPGGTDHGSDTTDSSTRIQSLEQRLSAQEQLRIQSEARLGALQDQITSLASFVAAMPRKQVSAPRVITPVTAAPAPKRSVKPATTQAHQGGWVINLVSLDSHAAAKKEQSRLLGLGIKADISQTTIRGSLWYRLRSHSFANRDDADAYKRSLAVKYGIKDAWTQKL
ncbi:MAG: SPOR domain-containing protein [Zetaproteobacteria bacterium CG12_big_fil_rev_8_21_14_0_65_54_13]|nr:MAG: SPOR domain-containing protein [Zetaproteobacteria bacterium CG23_combo_of_CG06-09_8_20_14_all_54_7]PIW47872.1 MAG: SPOR domain-containing protein [Zetaproteobacteria bacterium CG12_big_fil_rev_8_21_14_0_65_54_13]PIX54997.1 MAG: SPOR domain-containing protein [Zetaproteobacteria bacterium CG_4_10_14_3_um_filter_54_28]PJA28951.1 MAG: SPOR domain-containing protein [Zetaproteobacteria bacterium CG_4_9_14_3_um_filter_54_145]